MSGPLLIPLHNTWLPTASAMSHNSDRNGAMAEPFGNPQQVVTTTFATALILEEVLPQLLSEFSGPEKDLDNWIMTLKNLIQSYMIPSNQQVTLGIKTLNRTDKEIHPIPPRGGPRIHVFWGDIMLFACGYPRLLFSIKVCYRLGGDTSFFVWKVKQFTGKKCS